MNDTLHEASNVKIIGINTYVLSFPLAKPFKASIRVIPSVEYIVVEVRTNSDITGIGYSFTFGQDLARVLKVLVEGLGQVLIGENPLQIRRLWQMMWEHLTFLGHGGAGITAMAALDISLWDILGKFCGQPLYRLLGETRPDVPAYGSGGSLDTDQEDLVAEMAGYVETGFEAVKMKIGKPRLEDDLTRIKAVRQAVGNHVRIIVDGNQRWSFKEAIRIGKMIEDYGIWWMEEPVLAYDFKGCAQVRANLHLSIATGETLFTPRDFHQLMEAEAADILMPNLQRVGGITGWWKIAEAADLRQLPIASHVYAEINTHLLAAATNGLILEVVPWWPKIFTQTLEIVGGRVKPTEGSGLGLTLDEEVITRHRIG